jgi:hypothetical protein
MAQLPDSGTHYMTPESLRAGLEECFGRGAISHFARESGISRSQLSRYLSASCPIPKHVAWLVDLCVAGKRISVCLDEGAHSAATLSKLIEQAKIACCARAKEFVALET